MLAVRKTSDSEDIEGVGPVSWEDTYEMLECCGCENVVLRHSHSFSELPEVEVAYYPPRVSRPTPPWKNKLPYRFSSLMDEIYSALHANSRCLALMGARTVVDMVVLDKIGDVGSFQQKLEHMEQRGFVSRQSREFLAVAFEAGSAAAHRGFRPMEEQLLNVMDIVENLLQAVYVLQDAAAELRKATPPRRRKKQSS